MANLISPKKFALSKCAAAGGENQFQFNGGFVDFHVAAEGKERGGN